MNKIKATQLNNWKQLLNGAKVKGIKWSIKRYIISLIIKEMHIRTLLAYFNHQLLIMPTVVESGN